MTSALDSLVGCYCTYPMSYAMTQNAPGSNVILSSEERAEEDHYSIVTQRNEMREKA